MGDIFNYIVVIVLYGDDAWFRKRYIYVEWSLRYYYSTNPSEVN